MMLIWLVVIKRRGGWQLILLVSGERVVGGRPERVLLLLLAVEVRVDLGVLVLHQHRVDGHQVLQLAPLNQLLRLGVQAVLHVLHDRLEIRQGQH